MADKDSLVHEPKKVSNGMLIMYLVRKIKNLNVRVERLEEDVKKLVENSSK